MLYIKGKKTLKLFWKSCFSQRKLTLQMCCLLKKNYFLQVQMENQKLWPENLVLFTIAILWHWRRVQDLSQDAAKVHSRKRHGKEDFFIFKKVFQSIISVLVLTAIFHNLNPWLLNLWKHSTRTDIVFLLSRSMKCNDEQNNVSSQTTLPKLIQNSNSTCHVAAFKEVFFHLTVLWSYKQIEAHWIIFQLQKSYGRLTNKQKDANTHK